jgi:hypothetical protein
VITKTWREAGVVNDKMPPAVTMSLLDLVRLLYLLESPSERLHYFHRREQVQEIYRIVADEMGLLALYFATAFRAVAGGHDYATIVNRDV